MGSERGWGNPRPFESRSRFHFFSEGRSLCGKWMRFDGTFLLEEGNDEHSDNCAECKRRKRRLGGPDDRGPKLTAAHKAAAERASKCLVADGGDDDGFQDPD